MPSRAKIFSSDVTLLGSSSTTSTVIPALPSAGRAPSPDSLSSVMTNRQCRRQLVHSLTNRQTSAPSPVRTTSLTRLPLQAHCPNAQPPPQPDPPDVYPFAVLSSWPLRRA